VNAPDAWLLVLAGVLVPVAGALAAADAAISAVSAARVEDMARSGRRGAAALAAVVGDRSRYINLLLMLRLTAEIAATVILTVAALGSWGSHPCVVLVVIVVMLLVSYIVIGVLPRTLGRAHPYRLGLTVAGPTRALGRVLAPVSTLLIVVGNALTPGKKFSHGPFSSDIELREMVDLAGDRGVVHESEREMLKSVFDLGDTIVREVMVPRTEVVWIEQGKTLRQAVHLADRSGFSRIPVIGDDVDDVTGVVYVKDLIARLLSLAADDRGPQVTELMRPPVFVPESKNVDGLLRDMQRDRTHVAIVVDEYGGMAGLVTMEDIVEEIVGEITDEYDPDTPDPIEHLADGSVRLSARLPVEDLGDVFGIDLEGDEVETVGGLLAQLLGRVALPGAQAEIDGVRLVAEGGVDRRGRWRVVSLRAWRVPDTDRTAKAIDGADTDAADTDAADAGGGDAGGAPDRANGADETAAANATGASTNSLDAAARAGSADHGAEVAKGRLPGAADADGDGTSGPSRRHASTASGRGRRGGTTGTT
jgi:CBS domain containing-hemolysin-like protein